MRTVKHPQHYFGEINIADIPLDPRSRDDIPAILKGLQYIYTTDDVREKVFATLEETLEPSVNTATGRPGMELWKIFVLATLKLGLNCDFDRLQELANEHKTLRQMLGHSGWADTTVYKLQTLVDNVSMLKPSVLASINQVVVEAGHAVAKKKPGDELRTRCDSFVVETDVHYPTDINLLWDAIRKVIELTGDLCEREGVTDWRQYRFNVKQMKRLYRIAQKTRYSSSQDEKKKASRSKQMHQVYGDYLSKAQQMMAKSRDTLATLSRFENLHRIEQINHFIQHAERQIDQIERRVI